MVCCNRSTVRVDIEDNGPGVPEDILESGVLSTGDADVLTAQDLV